MNSEITAIGSNGSLTVTEDGVLIRRKSDVLTFLNQGLQGDKTIPWRSITAVQFKAAGKHMTGYIQFSAHGHVEPKRGLFPHVNDENCVLFLRDQQGAFERAKTEIDARIRALSAPAPAVAPMPAFSAAAELEKLAALLDKGLLTREEFDERKKVILSISPTAMASSRQTASPPARPPALALSPRPSFSHPEPLQRPDYEPPAREAPKSGSKGMLLVGAGGLAVILLIALGRDKGAGSGQTPSASPTSYRSPTSSPYVPPQPAATPPQPLSPSQGTTGQRTMTTVQGANLRSLAGMEGSVVRQIPVNAQVSMLETSGNWVRVNYEGSVGWIFRSLLRE